MGGLEVEAVVETKIRIGFQVGGVLFVKGFQFTDFVPLNGALER
jgi:hypothetical protein